MPIVWSIAGTDPSAGAGIQADLKTMQGLGVYGCTVITAVIAQSTQGVRRIEPVPADLLRDQLEHLLDDMPPDAIKIGMLPTTDSIRTVAMFLENIDAPVIYDPVLKSSSGTSMMEPEGLAALEQLLKQADCVTPNLTEAKTLTGQADPESAARILLNRGVSSALIKGGHGTDKYSRDWWTDGREGMWLNSPRRDTIHTHGTGCVLSSAIASCRALGYDWADSLVVAKAYINQGLRMGCPVGKGRGPVAHGGWPSHPDDMPWICDAADDGHDRYRFPSMDTPIGLYPVVDSFEWVQRLVPLGVSTIQLRIKQTLDAEIEEEIRKSVDFCRNYPARLFINDHWEPAIRCGAYGVHLGQDDLDSSALEAIMKAGLRLGVSTHSYSEIARALNINPSYVAIGTVFQSPSKQMTYPPLGVETFSRLRRMVPCPVVAIGGITVVRAPELIAAGADGLAVISDVTQASDIEARVAEWSRVFVTTV